ncbi:MAG: cysteine hydrolase family protein [Clostridia bacterium]
MTDTRGADALLLIDIQRDYFPGGKMALYEPARAATAAGLLLERFRRRGRPVIHVQHHAVRPGSGFLVAGSSGVEPWTTVRPAGDEPVIIKHFPNSFRETELRDVLDRLRVKTLAVGGMMTHMCVDATVRQATDYGYEVLVAGDACATRELAFEGRSVPAPDVHAAFLAALDGSYGRVVSTEALLDQL